MKRILSYIVMAIVALVAISCNEQTKKKVLLPNISGKAGEVIVVIGKADWEALQAIPSATLSHASALISLRGSRSTHS